MAERMKDSGNRWIGEIPESWNTKKIKYLANLKGRIGWQGLTSDEYQDEGAFLITGTDFDNGKINWDTCVHVPMKRWEEAKEIQIQNGDLLITKDGTVGKVAIVSDIQGETSLNSGVLRIMTNEGYNRRFLFWVLQSDVFWNWFNYKNAGNSTIVHLYQGDFAEFMYAFPAEKEQRAIADFLDKRCAQIDGVITDLEKQIELLCQYKTSILRELTSRGIDNGMFKSTGIEWLSEIPEHWSMSKMRYIADICSGATPSKDNLGYWEGDIPWISSMEVKTDILYDTSLHISEEAVSSCSTQIMPIDTMVMVVRSGILQHTLPVALLGVPATINQDIKAFTFNVGVSSAYVKYFIQGNNDALLDTLLKDKSTVESIEYSRLLGCPIPIPPLNEQEEIVKVLDKKCSLIDSIVSDKRRQLEDAVQNRKSLIYEYVTGKKRVKEVDGYAD